MSELKEGRLIDTVQVSYLQCLSTAVRLNTEDLSRPEAIYER